MFRPLAAAKAAEKGRRSLGGGHLRDQWWLGVQPSWEPDPRDFRSGGTSQGIGAAGGRVSLLSRQQCRFGIQLLRRWSQRQRTLPRPVRMRTCGTAWSWS